MLNGGWNEIRYVNHAATHVALPGPPWVMAKIASNTMKANVVRRTRLTRDHRAQERKRDAPEALPAGRPVDGRRLVELAGHALESRVVEQDVERRRSPDVRGDHG